MAETLFLTSTGLICQALEFSSPQFASTLPKCKQGVVMEKLLYSSSSGVKGGRAKSQQDPNGVSEWLSEL